MDSCPQPRRLRVGSLLFSPTPLHPTSCLFRVFVPSCSLSVFFRPFLPFPLLFYPGVSARHRFGESRSVRWSNPVWLESWVPPDPESGGGNRTSLRRVHLGQGRDVSRLRCPLGRGTWTGFPGGFSGVWRVELSSTNRGFGTDTLSVSGRDPSVLRLRTPSVGQRLS